MRTKDEGQKTINAIRAMVQGSATLSKAIRQFRKGDMLITEGEENDSLFLILEGTVQLTKSTEEGGEIIVMMIQPGDFVGLISFYIRGRAFSSVMAKTSVRVLGFNRQEFSRLSDDFPELHHLLQPLVVSNLADRYRRIVQLHVEVALLTKELESERNHLQSALEKLRQTQSRLIHQEKMATLGQLVAGLAHEINNPTASLLRSIDTIIQELPRLQNELITTAHAPTFHRFVTLGLSAVLSDTESVRTELEQLEGTYPHIPRSQLRTIAQMSGEGRQLLRPFLDRSASAEGLHDLSTALDCHELGVFLKTSRVSAERIGGLVGSLKRYGRPEKETYEVVDIREGIVDTLLILGNRLRKIELRRELKQLPMVKCVVGEINQVWTNILLNAVEAMEGMGTLLVACDSDEKEVWVAFEDSGPGVPQELISKIFEPNFTTKTASGKFGLGLGLAISNEIVLKHGGRFIVGPGKEGGARFTVFLPRSF